MSVETLKEENNMGPGLAYQRKICFFLYSCVSSNQENFLLTLCILQMLQNLSGTNHHSPSKTMPLACIYLPACFLKGPLTTASPNSCHNCRTHLCLKTLGDIFRKIRLRYWPLEILAEPTLITLLYVKNDYSVCFPSCNLLQTPRPF